MVACKSGIGFPICLPPVGTAATVRGMDLSLEFRPRTLAGVLRAAAKTFAAIVLTGPR